MSEKVPHGYAEIVQCYGDPRVIRGKVDRAWEERSMVLVRDLPGIAKLYMHRKVVAPLRAVLTRLAQLGYMIPVDHNGHALIGCFNPRAKRSSTDLSLHAFGIAFDIDPDNNPGIANCPPGDPRRDEWAKNEKRIPQFVIEEFKAEGFTNGADFSRYFDPQHFQLSSGY